METLAILIGAALIIWGITEKRRKAKEDKD
jgi:hypothetical protein